MVHGSAAQWQNRIGILVCALALGGCFEFKDVDDDIAVNGSDDSLSLSNDGQSGSNSAGNSNPPPSADTEQPELGIVSPTADASLVTSSPTITLTGFARDNVGVRTMDWISSRGGADIIAAAPSWRTGAIALQPGDNRITVSAADAAGNSSEIVVVITYDDTVPSDVIRPPVAKISYSQDLSNAFLLDGQTLEPRFAYLIIDPGSEWTNRGLQKVDFYCCKGIGGSDDPHNARATDQVPPFIHQIDLSQLQAGTMRELYVDAWLSQGDRVEDHVVTFQVAAANAPEPSNRAPQISGNAPGSVNVADTYSFVPSASDPDGDALIFSVENLPGWASFDDLSGQIVGTPGAGDVGTYNNIIISVFDGEARTELAGFSINVVALATGSATLSWTAPIEREDNSPLTNLAGYRIYYGSGPGDYPNRVDIDNAGVTSAVIDGLAAGDWYFVATSRDADGLESDFTNEVIVAVGP